MGGGSGGVQAATPVQQTDATNSNGSIFFLVEIGCILIAVDFLPFSRVRYLFFFVWFTVLAFFYLKMSGRSWLVAARNIIHRLILLQFTLIEDNCMGFFQKVQPPMFEISSTVHKNIVFTTCNIIFY